MALFYNLAISTAGFMVKLVETCGCLWQYSKIKYVIPGFGLY